MTPKDNGRDDEEPFEVYGDPDAIEIALPPTCCGICGCLISHLTPGNLCFVTLAPNDPIKDRYEELQGSEIKIQFIGTTKLEASALCLPRDSIASGAGFDLMFVICSEDCGVTLLEAMKKEASMHSKRHLQ